MKRFMCIALLCLCGIGIVFAGGASEKATQGKVYVFAADATWPPLEFVDDQGNLTGFEVELMPAIGKEVGVNMTVKNIPWDTIFAGLANGAYDGVSSGVTVTEERKQTMAFSTPILSNGQVVIIRSSDSSKVASIKDLTGKKIGVQIGTTGDFSLENYKVDAKRYDDIGLAIEDMLNGNVDACVCDSLIASDFVLSNENYKGRLSIAGEPFTQEDIAIAVKKDNTALLKLVNDGLAAMEKDGSLAELKKKWNIL